MRRIPRFFSLTRDERALFLEAYAALIVARVRLLLPSRQLTAWMGDPHRETTRELSPEHSARVRDIRRAIARASRYTPWVSLCLPQALAAAALLRRRNIPVTIYLGVARTAPLGLDAHAWTRSGSLIVTGEREAARHTELASFAVADR